MAKNYTLPELPYDYQALEPAISGEIMKLHHQKHHNTYVTKLNEALEKYEAAEKEGDLSTMIALQPAIRFNGGGHLNHSLFWENLAPAGKGGAPSGDLAEAINSRWGSLEEFTEKFNTTAAPIQGSGWCWLGFCKTTHQLVIETCANQDPLLGTKCICPLLGVDMWEHAYYLQYNAARPEYLKSIWSVINWETVAKRYQAVMDACPACVR